MATNFGFCKQGFLTLTGAPASTVKGYEGWRAISIKCADDSAQPIVLSSDLNGSNATIAGIPLGSIVLAAGETSTVGASSDKEIDGLIIDTSAGGTAKIQGSRFHAVDVTA